MVGSSSQSIWLSWLRCVLPLNTGLAFPLIIVFTLYSISNLSSKSLLKAGFVSVEAVSSIAVLAGALGGITLPAALKDAPTTELEGFVAAVEFVPRKLVGLICLLSIA